MSEFEVTSSRGSYRVKIQPGGLADVLTGDSIQFVDSNVSAMVPTSDRRIEFQAIESEKNLRSVEQLIADLFAVGTTRGSTLVAVGGGVVQDVATLAASLYMRGINWTYAPSTAMAMLDSCIGGKSSINAAGVKNLVGNIYPPSTVIVDPQLAGGLSVEARVAGFAEAVKICFARDDSSFNSFCSFGLDPSNFGSREYEEESSLLVHHVLTAKKWFVEVDEFDRRERQLLNFGHTFGHALEAALAFTTPHGIAVAVGMLAALDFAKSEDSRATELRAFIERLARSLSPLELSALDGADWERFRRAIAADKKGTKDCVRFVLCGRDGRLLIVEEPRSDVTYARAEESMRSAIDAFTRAGSVSI